MGWSWSRQGCWAGEIKQVIGQAFRSLGLALGRAGAGSHWIVTLGFIHRLSQVGQEGPGSSYRGLTWGLKKTQEDSLRKSPRERASMNTSVLLASGALWDLLVSGNAEGNRPRH